MGLTVKVQFPEGIREVPAYVQVPWHGCCGMHYGDDMSVVTPHTIDGWEFRQIVGGDPQWHAMQVPTRQERKWGEDLPHSYFCDDYSHSY